MAKIYEALELAQRVRTREERPFTDPDPEDPPKGPAKPEFGMHHEMALLYQRIDSLLDGSPKKVILFIAAREGEGTSTVVREFARTSARLLGKSVFTFDADLAKGLPAPDPEPVEAKVARNDPASTSICLIPQDFNNARKHFYSPKIDSFWDGLRQQFDLVLIDSPPFETSPDGIAISGRVDGVVIVLEAEKTRWPIAEQLKEQILASGGNILGVVFNKRRYYIPEFIYKRI